MRKSNIIFLALALCASALDLHAAPNDKGPNPVGEWDTNQGKIWIILSDDLAFGYTEKDGGLFLAGVPSEDSKATWDFTIRGTQGQKGLAHFEFLANNTCKGDWSIDSEDKLDLKGKRAKDKLPPPPAKGAIGGKWTPEAEPDSFYVDLKQNGNFAFGTMAQPETGPEEAVLIMFANVKNQWHWLMFGPKGPLFAHETENLLDIVGEATFDGKLVTMVPRFAEELEEDPEPLVLTRKKN